MLNQDVPIFIRFIISKKAVFLCKYNEKRPTERAGIRTRDNLIKSQVLYRLSYTPLLNLKCPKSESNQRHEDFQSSALPTELSGLFLMPEHKKLRGQDLNLRPSGYEPDELPDCSTPR